MNCSRLSRWLPWLHRTPLRGKVWRFFLPSGRSPSGSVERSAFCVLQPLFDHPRYCGAIELIEWVYGLIYRPSMLQVDHAVVIVLVVTMMTSKSEAQLNSADAAALFDLCDRPGMDLWTNCSDSANACTNSANWPGVVCDATNTSILNMYD